MLARRARVVRSPREAAMGVATLSGLMFHLELRITTRIMMIPRTKEAMEAVRRLEAERRRACLRLNSPAGIQSIKMAKQAARKATTAA